MQEINSEYVIKLYGQSVAQNGDRVLVLELCNGGDLRSFIELRDGILKEEEAHWLLSQIIKAIIDYSKCRVVHRDLKLLNLALVVEGEVFKN